MRKLTRVLFFIPFPAQRTNSEFITIQNKKRCVATDLSERSLDEICFRNL